MRLSRREDGVRDDRLHREQLQVLGGTPGEPLDELVLFQHELVLFRRPVRW